MQYRFSGVLVGGSPNSCPGQPIACQLMEEACHCVGVEVEFGLIWEESDVGEKLRCLAVDLGIREKRGSPQDLDSGCGSAAGQTSPGGANLPWGAWDDQEGTEGHAGVVCIRHLGREVQAEDMPGWRRRHH